MASSSRGGRICNLPGCSLPVHFDANSNIEHDYCGRTHARQAIGSALQEPHGSCHECQLTGCSEPVYYDQAADRVHEYCCRTHAELALRQGERPYSNKVKQGQGARGFTCSLPNCSAPRFFDQDRGIYLDFCGRTHAKKAEARGNLPVPAGALSEQVSHLYRGRPGMPSYQISVLTNAHPKYQSVKDQFASGWSHPSACPTVMRILQIRNPASVWEAYQAHSSTRTPELRRFHGTSSACDFGVDVNMAPCEDPSCRVCSIAASGFKMEHAGGGPNAGNMALRYGTGLYFSKHSSKSDNYAEGSSRLRNVGPGGLQATHRVMCAGWS